MKHITKHTSGTGCLRTGLLLLVGVLAISGSIQADPVDACCATPATETAATLAAEWGIEVSSLRLSAQGYMIDFRYKVLDPAKAAALNNPKTKPILTDEASGTKLGVPNTPKAGPLRQTAEQLETGRIYWMLFGNPGRVVKAGSRITVQIGEFTAKHLNVE